MTDSSNEWKQLTEIKAELAERDWFMGTSGNLSLKRSIGSEFLITASGKDKRKQTSEDFLLVNAAGMAVENTQLRPSAEALLHVAVYQKTSARCVLHVHTVENNVISELYAEQGEITFQNHELIKATGRWEEDARLTVPIIQNFSHIPTLAAEFSKYVTDDFGAVLIRNHGITVWGRDGLEAKRILEACEFLFQYQLLLNQQRALTVSTITNV